MNDQALKYIEELQRLGPVLWAEGSHGWIGEDGRPITLIPWQRAALTTYWEHRIDTSTFAISNVKKTGKTFTNAILLCFRWLALPGPHFAAGNDLDQAQARQFAMIAEMVKRNPFLYENVKAGKSELEFTLTGSKLTALAADAAGNAGANHLTASHTEAWGILYEAGIRAWEELTPPPGRTYGLPALRIADSYAGFTGESKTWHKLIDRGLAGKHLPGGWPVFKAGGLLLFHMEGEEAQERCFRGSETERLDYYQEQSESLRPNAYTRMHFNQRTSGESAFVTEEQWQACYNPDIHPLYPGEKVKLALGADASTTHDFTSLVGMNGGDVRLVKVWKPKSVAGIRFGKPTVDLEATIGQEVLNMHKAGQVLCVVYDPWQMAAVARSWEKAGIRCVEMPQTAQRVEADTALFNAIISGQVQHFKSQDLDEAVRNAIIIETPRGIRLAKEKASRKIDPLVALSMANSAVLSGKYAEQTSGFIEDWEGWCWDHKDWNREPHPEGVTYANCPHRESGCFACVKEQKDDGSLAAQEKLDGQLSQVAMENPPDREFNVYLDTDAGQRLLTKYQESEEMKQPVLETFYRSIRNNRQKEKIK
jgi:phage terminase large subunit-like protein